MSGVLVETGCDVVVDDGPIPFQLVDPAGLVAMREWLSDEAVEVDELTLGRALLFYFESVANA